MVQYILHSAESVRLGRCVMAEFKLVLSTKDGKSFQREVKDNEARPFLGKKIGDEFDGIFVSLPGFKLILTGGSDKNGFPMRKDIHGMKRNRILLTKGVGFSPSKSGKRKRKSICGDVISPDIVQVNMKITSYGSKKIEDLLSQDEEKEK